MSFVPIIYSNNKIVLNLKDSCLENKLIMPGQLLQLTSSSDKISARELFSKQV